MTWPRRFFLAVFVFCFVFPAFTQEASLVVAGTTSKKLKREAHRMHISVQQLKNARQALEEATALAKGMNPPPIEQFVSLGMAWQQLNRSKAKPVIESLILGLRVEAENASDPQTYQRATSTAMTLIGFTAGEDYEKVLEQTRSWPNPPDSFGDGMRDFRDDLERQAKRQSIFYLIHSDPDKALSVLSQGTLDYSASALIAQGLMNAGKRDEGLRLIDQTLGSFTQQAADPRALQDYQNFVQMVIPNLDPARADTAINQLVSSLINHPSSAECNGTLGAGDAAVYLTCAESRLLGFVRGLPPRPELMLRTLDAIPGLKSKVEGVGGIDNFFSHKVTLDINSRINPQQTTGDLPKAPVHNPEELMKELKGKAESNPGFVKGKLRDFAKTPDDIDMLINLAMRAAYEDPELGSLVLEVVETLLPGVNPLERRSTTLQNLVRTCRQVEGEVDQELLRNGFVLADQLREKSAQLQTNETSANAFPVGPAGINAADQLEIFLVSDTARDSFEEAMRCVHAMENEHIKFVSLIQIAQSLGQMAY